MTDSYACGSASHINRRSLLKLAGMSGLSWLTPVSSLLARAEESSRHQRPKSVIMLWMAGGPSQLETFDPHPGTTIAAGTTAIPTAAKGVKLASHFEQLAEIMNEVALIRSVTSKEGDHARAVYNIKTGFRPVPALVHPSLGSVVCHQMHDKEVEIPRHVSILPNQWPARGGYLGAQYDAFKIYDPKSRVPDVTAHVPRERQERRLNGLDIVEQAFQKGRSAEMDDRLTLHRKTIQQALKMMSSDQLGAFNIADIPLSEQRAFGDTAFGRGCLAATRLVEAGVRCVEVTLDGWDTHINNHELQGKLVTTLDPAFTALIRRLKERDLLDNTIVVCGGEFGRTPQLNPAEGRDHWPHAFSIAMAGGGIQGGQVIGATDPRGEKKEPDKPIPVQNIHASILDALGINHEQEIDTPVGRPMALSDGRVIQGLFQS